jgi:dsRNA-specific ribonuclease
MLDPEKIERIEKQIGYSFDDKNKLVQAFTTKSYVKEAKEQNNSDKDCKSQEEYRTLGDAILKQFLIVLLKKNGCNTPKEITEAKIKLEKGEKQAEIFSSFNIPFDHFQTGGGEKETTTLQAETFKSLICAIYDDISSKSDKESANTEISEYISKWYKQHITNIS